MKAANDNVVAETFSLVVLSNSNVHGVARLVISVVIFVKA